MTGCPIPGSPPGGDKGNNEPTPAAGGPLHVGRADFPTLQGPGRTASPGSGSSAPWDPTWWGLLPESPGTSPGERATGVLSARTPGGTQVPQTYLGPECSVQAPLSRPVTLPGLGLLGAGPWWSPGVGRQGDQGLAPEEEGYRPRKPREDWKIPGSQWTSAGEGRRDDADQLSHRYCPENRAPGPQATAP